MSPHSIKGSCDTQHSEKLAATEEFFGDEVAAVSFFTAKYALMVFSIITVIAIFVTTTILYHSSFNEPYQQAISNNAQQPQIILAAAAIKSAPTPIELQALAYIHEEERLARDVYFEMFKLWGLSIFKSISEEEQEHINVTAHFLRIFNINNLYSTESPGQYANNDLTLLYQTLTRKGAVSAKEALSACALQKEINMIDLNKATSVTLSIPAKDTYQELHKESTNHLRSFSHALELLWVRYHGAFLSQQVINSIIGSPMDRGFMRRKAL